MGLQVNPAFSTNLVNAFRAKGLVTGTGSQAQALAEARTLLLTNPTRIIRNWQEAGTEPRRTVHGAVVALHGELTQGLAPDEIPPAWAAGMGVFIETDRPGSVREEDLTPPFHALARLAMHAGAEVHYDRDAPFNVTDFLFMPVGGVPFAVRADAMADSYDIGGTALTNAEIVKSIETFITRNAARLFTALKASEARPFQQALDAVNALSNDLTIARDSPQARAKAAAMLTNGDGAYANIPAAAYPKEALTDDLKRYGDFAILRRLVKLAGTEGLLSGGFGLDLDPTLATKALFTETLMRLAPDEFVYAIGGHAGIGSLPIILYGTDEQKAKYLERLKAGDLISCFALTEPGAGSDVRRIATRATLMEVADGEDFYLLKGEKCFITNGAFADIAIVFAQSEQGMVALMVELRDEAGTLREGFSVERTEDKIGLHAADTAHLRFDNLRVPISNLLGAAGKGHRVAYGTLTEGRYGIAAGTVGSLSPLIAQAAAYAVDRTAFNQPIANFGAVRQRLVGPVLDVFMLESMLYRVAGRYDALLTQRLGALAASEAITRLATEDDRKKALADLALQERIKLLQEFSAIMAVLKVEGSEAYTRGAWNLLHVFGGHGFMAESPAGTAWCDAVVTEIFEGTNEIQRTVIMPKQIAGAFITLLSGGGSIYDDKDFAQVRDRVDRSFAGHRLQEAIRQAELAKLLLRGLYNQLFHAGQKLAAALQSPGQGQFFTTRLSNLFASALAMDSAVQHALKMMDLAGDGADLKRQMAEVVCHERMTAMLADAREILRAAKDIETDIQLDAVSSLLDRIEALALSPQRSGAVDTEKNAIAERLIADGEYPF